MNAPAQKRKRPKYTGLFMTCGQRFTGHLLFKGHAKFIRAYDNPRPVLLSHFMDAPIPINDNGGK